MDKKNIRYKSREILDFYRSSRRTWEEFYPSEKAVFEKVALARDSLGDVLDAGCACGGLGSALSERFAIRSYTGIDIHEDAIDWARREKKLTVPATFIAGDIAGHAFTSSYDTVVSLGCADWNIETAKIINSCWKNVKAGGYLIISLRLTPQDGINDIGRSYQLINFSGNDEKPEIANYVVLNIEEAIEMLRKLSPTPGLIGAYGYWGLPSSTAVTPFEKIIFSVFYLKKQTVDPMADTQMLIDLPQDALAREGAL